MNELADDLGNIAAAFDKTQEEVLWDAEELRVLGNEHRNTRFSQEYADALRSLNR